jgi:hypothetical protein
MYVLDFKDQEQGDELMLTIDGAKTHARKLVYALAIVHMSTDSSLKAAGSEADGVFERLLWPGIGGGDSPPIGDRQENERPSQSDDKMLHDQKEPLRGVNLVTAGRGAFLGGLAAIGLSAVAFKLSEKADRDRDPHANVGPMLVGLCGVYSVALSPFLYFPGLAREERYKLWRDGKLESAEPSNDGDSATNRQGKFYGLHINIAGSEGGLGYSQGVIFSKFLNHDKLLELNLAISNGYEDIGFNQKHAVYRYYAARYTQFLSNSLYLTGGIAYRYFHGQVSTRLDASNAIEPSSRIQFYQTKKEDAGIDIALGNRWQWNEFSLGFDWFGLYAPQLTISDSRQRDVIPNSADRDQSNRAVRSMDLIRQVGFQTTRLYVGATF